MRCSSCSAASRIFPDCPAEKTAGRDNSDTGVDAMKLILPPGLSERGLNRALDAFAGVVGRDWVLRTDEDRETYLDVYAPGNEASHAPSAAVAPASAEEVQAIVRLANEHRVPLWPISRGK